MAIGNRHSLAERRILAESARIGAAQVIPAGAAGLDQPRGQVAAGSVAPALQRVVNKVDPNLPLYFVGTPKDNQDTFLAQNRIIAMMFSVFGIVAVVLAAVGLYGVMSFSVNQRTQEFGVRIFRIGSSHEIQMAKRRKSQSS